MTSERQPQLVEDNDFVRDIQQIEASRHDKIDTFEQARLDAIARLMLADDKSANYTIEQKERISKVKAKQIQSIKQRQPEFHDDEDVKTLQQIEAAKHNKIDTFEQERLNMMARLAANDSLNDKAQRAADLQKKSILGKSGDALIDNNNNNNNNKGTKSREEREISITEETSPIQQYDGSQMYGFNYDNELRDDVPFETSDTRLRKLNQDMNNLHDTYMIKLKEMENKYQNKIRILQDRIEADKAVLRSKDEMIQNITKENAKKIKYLEKSKYNLIKSTAKEIDSLRKQIKMYNQGRIA